MLYGLRCSGPLAPGRPYGGYCPRPPFGPLTAGPPPRFGVVDRGFDPGVSGFSCKTSPNKERLKSLEGYLTSLHFKEGVLRDEDDPLRLGGRSALTLSLFVLPFSRMSPELLKFWWSPLVCGELAS